MYNFICLDYKVKKRILIVSIILLFIPLVINRMYCFVFPWISAMWEVGKQFITDETFEGIGHFLTQIIDGIGSLVCNALTEGIKPGLSKFNEMLGIGEGSVGTSICEGCQIFGMTLSIIILLFSLFCTMVNRKMTETKDHPLKLLLMFGIACLFIYTAPSISIYASTLFGNIYDIVTTSATNTLTFKHFMPLSDSGDTFLGSIAIYGTELAQENVKWYLFPLGAILAWPLLKNYFRLAVELIERYIVSCLLLLMFPAIVPSIISINSRNVFKSYLRMLTCQMFLIIMSGVFIKGATFLIIGKGLTSGIFGYIFTLAFLRAAQRLDSYMASMGLNIAQTGSSLLDSMGGAGRSMLNAVRDANYLRKNVGSGMQAIGARTNNASMIKSGNLLGANIGDIAKNGGIGSERSMLEKMSTYGTRTNDVSNTCAAGVLNDYLNNPENRSCKNVVGALGDEALTNGVQTLTGLEEVNNVSLDSKTGSINFDAIGSDGETHSMTLSTKDDGLSQEAIDADGNKEGLFLNTKDTLGDGEILSGENISSVDILNQTGSLGLPEKTSLSTEEISSITSAEKYGGLTFFNNEDNNAICAKQGGNYYEQSSDAKNGVIGNNLKSNIESATHGTIMNEGEVSFRNGVAQVQIKRDGYETPDNITIRDEVASKYSGRKNDISFSRKNKSSGARSKFFITFDSKKRDTRK